MKKIKEIRFPRNNEAVLEQWLLAEVSLTAVAETLEVGQRTVGRWRQRINDGETLSDFCTVKNVIGLIKFHNKCVDGRYKLPVEDQNNADEIVKELNRMGYHITKEKLQQSRKGGSTGKIDTSNAVVPTSDTNVKGNLATNDQTDLATNGQADLVKSGQADLVTNGQADLVKSDQADLATNGQADLVTNGQADLVKSDQADLATNGQADLVTNGQADLVKSDQADLATNDQTDLAKSDQADLATNGQADLVESDQADLATNDQTDLARSDQADLATTGVSTDEVMTLEDAENDDFNYLNPDFDVIKLINVNNDKENQKVSLIRVDNLNKLDYKYLVKTMADKHVKILSSASEYQGLLEQAVDRKQSVINIQGKIEHEI